jgi:hypothetical protein
MDDSDHVADTEIAALVDRLSELAGMRRAYVADREHAVAGSWHYVEVTYHIAIIGDAIRRVQAVKAQWVLAKATRRFILAAR